MAISTENSITLDEVDKALAEIENKYSDSPQISDKTDNTFKDSLIILSKEFDSLGLPVLNLSQPVIKVFKEVIKSARCLVHIHRNAVSHSQDVNIENITQEAKRKVLYSKIEEYKLKLKRAEVKCSEYYNKIDKLHKEKNDLVKKETEWKKELDKIKKYYQTKENELHHTVRKLKKENDHLQQICSKDINTRCSNADIAMDLLKKYKINEDIYRETIQKLQENNKELLDEVLNLREDYLLNNQEQE